MDEGFVSEGLAPRVGTRARTGVRGATGKALHAPEDAAITTMQAASTAGTVAFFGAFMGPAVGGWLGKITSRWPHVSTVIKSIIVAPFKALKETKLDSMQHFFVNYRKEVSEIAKEANLHGWASKLDMAAKQAEVGANAFGVKAAKFVKPMGDGIVGTAEKLKNTPINDGVKRAMNWRAGVNEAKHLRFIEKADKAFTRQMRGMFWREISKEGMPSQFAKPEVKGAYDAAKGLRIHDPKRVEAFEGVTKAVEKEVEVAQKGANAMANGAAKKLETKLAGQLSQRGGVINETIRLAGNKLNAAHMYRAGANEGLSGLAKSAAKSVGKSSLLTGVIVAGAVAGAAAILLTGKKHTREGKEALHGLIADIGDENHPIVVEAKKVHKKQGGMRGIADGMMASGELINGALMTLPNFGGVAGMGGIMALQMGSSGMGMFVPENAVLDAYAALKANEEGRAKLEPAQQVYFTKALVALVPAVAKNGGERNKLAEPIASAIVERHMSVRDSLQLMANADQFTALAREVNEKQMAKEAAAPTAELTAPKPEKPATAAYQAADKPATTKVDLSAGMAHERLQQAQKSLVQ